MIWAQSLNQPISQSILQFHVFFSIFKSVLHPFSLMNSFYDALLNHTMFIQPIESGGMMWSKNGARSLIWNKKSITMASDRLHWAGIMTSSVKWNIVSNRRPIFACGILKYTHLYHIHKKFLQTRNTPLPLLQGSWALCKLLVLMVYSLTNIFEWHL